MNDKNAIMNTFKKKMIGVVGGVGPYAGVDLFRKILNQTKATCDQDYLPMVMLSVPHSIPDRTEFLIGNSDVNPALAISDVICMLNKHGASIIGIPCNTAHAPPIYREILNRIPEDVKLIHMINEVAAYIKKRYPSVIKVGILSTTGTYNSNVYPNNLSEYGLVGIQVSEEIQRCLIHPAIYDTDYGVKAQSNPVSTHAKMDLHTGLEYLLGKGVEAVVLGCTEIPVALIDEDINGIPLIDSTKVLARALILESSPNELLE